MWRMYAGTFLADYSRLENTPFERKRLVSLRAIVVGAGSLGNEVTRTLGLLGAGQVTVVDPDIVEPSNLPRSVLFCGRNSIGVNKATALRDGAAALFPDTDWMAISSEIADVGFQKIADSNLLFSCVDSDLARLETAYICARLRLPMVDGGLGIENYSHGRVTYYPGADDQACYACMLPPSKRRELLACWQATLRPCGSRNGTNAELVSTPTMASIIASLQVELGLRTFFKSEVGTGTQAYSVEIDIHPSRKISEVKVPMSAACPFHNFADSLHALPEQNATFGQLLDHVGSGAVILDWPICVEAKCLECGEIWRPMLRLAVLRRRGRCPNCHSDHILEQQILRSISRESAWLHYPPSVLQLPADHLYSLSSLGAHA